MTTHEVLVAARNRLARDGWAQRNDWATGKLSDCAYLACQHVSDEQQARAPARALIAVLGLDPLGLSPLFRWNDAPGRTKEEVLAAFDKAIAATAPEPDTSFLPELTRDPVPA